MVAGANSKGEQKERLTQKRAAEMLGITPWYLNRVIRGHIKSVRLSKRLAELQLEHSNLPVSSNQSAQPGPPMNEDPRFPTDTPDKSYHSAPAGWSDPVNANYCFETGEEFGKIGYTIICIQLVQCSAGYASSNSILAIADDFSLARLGFLDGSKYQPKIHHFFIGKTKKLSAALDFLKTKLAQHDLQAIACIGCVDVEAKVWRLVHPGSELAKREADSES